MCHKLVKQLVKHLTFTNSGITLCSLLKHCEAYLGVKDILLVKVPSTTIRVLANTAEWKQGKFDNDAQP